MCSVLILLLKITCFYCFVVSSHSIYGNETYKRVSRQASGCLLPKHPKFGQWTIYQETSELQPGTFVPLKTVLLVNCQDHYKLDGNVAIVCIDGQWSSEIGPCLKTCPPIYSTPVMYVTCTYNSRKRENCTEAVDGTVAKFHCADFYEDQGLERHPFHVCYNGKWSHNTPQCEPICGQKTIDVDPTLIVGGRNVTKGEYPWQIAVYNISSKNLICGGTLINQRVVLTAAHCVTDENGKLQSKELYMLAAGKYYRNYDDSRDFHNAQFSPIYEMYIPRQYRGDIQNYFGDVAILVTKKTFVLSTRVQPVCVDWAFSRISLLDPNKTKQGYVSGWGYTVEHKQPSEVLKELEVPLISDDQCGRQLPEDYFKFMTEDKLCAGYLSSGTSVCRGDSGGGLVVRHGTRYYLIAVVSLSPQAPTEVGACDSQHYALYTKVSYYIETFILEKWALFKPSTILGDVDSEDDPGCKSAASTVSPITTTTTTTESPVTEVAKDQCVLPDHPTSGKWSVYGLNKKLSPGMTVSRGTILQLSCNDGYELIGQEVNLCADGKWSVGTVQCLQICPPLYSTETVAITCTFKNNETTNCEKAVEGTIAKQQCAPFYEDLQLTKNGIRVCRKGSWVLPKAECVPACGHKSVTAQPLIVNGTIAKRGDYPWHVGIYRVSTKRFICSGALISQKVILTAAHCVTTYDNKILSKDNLVVAVGKYHVEFYDSTDIAAQFSKIKDILIPLEYGGINGKYLADIAVLVTERTFTLSRSVQPVCVDWVLNFDPSNFSSGYISGWGFTGPNGSPARELTELQVHISTTEECSGVLSEDFRSFLTQDKLCAGYFNMSTSACSGDAGGALVTKSEDRYYIAGINSVAPARSDGGCDTQKYTLYTKVSTYISFILEKEAQFKPIIPSDRDCQNNENCQKPTEKPSTEPGPSSGEQCTLPQHPNFGKWSLYEGTVQLAPGNPVASGSVLQISCQNRFKLDGNSVILCENGKWSANIGKCLRTCPPVHSTSVVTVTCVFSGKVENCREATHGTQVKYECAPFYEDSQLSQNPVHLCQNGSWDHPPPQCVPVCGQKSVNAQTLIINGNPVKRGEFPWHVAIYRGSGKKFVCSGTLINQRVILTAAHCVADYEGKSLSKDIFNVAAGKYYRKMDDSRERMKDVQFSTLHDVFIPAQYKGLNQSYIGNIAVLITSRPFTLSHKVQPVCVDWSSQNLQNLENNLTGSVIGWGFTNENQNPSDELRELKVPTVSNELCKQLLPDDFQEFFTSDKFCAGYYNEGKSVCTGDSGGGLVMKFNGRYYITGIVAIAPAASTGSCDSQKYALYTKVADYTENFILPKSIQYPS